MKISIRNIGKLKEAEVEINGITVIAGENDTGKSTVGKALWSIFNSFFDIEKQIKEYRDLDIEDSLRRLRRTGIREKLEIPKEIREDTEENREKLKEIIIENLRIEEDVEEINDVIDDIFENLKISKEQIEDKIINEILLKEFNRKINNVYNETLGEIKLNIKNNNFEILIENNKIKAKKYDIILNKEALYIDDSNILENLREYIFIIKNKNILDHKEQLKRKLRKVLFYRENIEENIIKEIVVDNKLEKIFKNLSEIIKGEIINKRYSLNYTLDNKKEGVSLESLSMGLKTFIVIKLLLENNLLEKNGTIILDEPEIHLHPEWQLKFAEIIVLLQKEFGMHILLTTHSPYFVSAIEVFSEKYNIEDKSKYYVAENKKEGSIIRDITSNTKEIYQKMARPLQDLENLRYSDNNE